MSAIRPGLQAFSSAFNRIAMKKLLYILAGLGLAACTSDIEELPEVGPQPGREVTLTGISGTASRTQFVPGDGTEIQFQWSTGDRIWAGGVQSAEAGTDGNVADFGFTNLPGAAPYRIYYNMTGTDAEAVVPTEQRQAEPGKLQLGPNGDFGYATTDSEGRFTLSHATAYVWFNPWSQDVKEKLVSVTLAATDASTVLTGTRTFDGTGFSDATDANNAVTLSFGKEGVELPATSSTASVFAAAVVYPADCSAEEIHVTYTFADGSVYTETKTGRNFEAGRIYRLTTEIAKRDGGSLEIQGLEDSDEPVCMKYGASEAYALTAEGWIPTVEMTSAPAGWTADFDIARRSLLIAPPAEYTDGMDLENTVTIQSDDKPILSQEYYVLDFTHPEGTFVLIEGNMTSENGTIVYFDQHMRYHEKVYEEINDNEIGNVLQDMYLANGKIYFITQNGKTSSMGTTLIYPDPATVADWNQEWQFLVSSYDNQNDRTYLYTVERTDIATDGSLTLRTQAEVDAFARSGINTVEGNLTIGGEDEENPVTNLDGLKNLVSVRCDLTITAAYTGETLAGLENLTACESLRIGSAAHPNETLRQLSLPALKEIKGDLCVYGTALQTADFKSLQSVAGHFVLQSDALLQLTADELTTVAGNMTLIGTTADEAKAPCEQMYFPKLQRIDGTLTLSRFDRLSGLGTTFGVLTQAGALRYEHLALANTFEFPLIETTGNITVTDCPILRSVLLPALTDAGSLEITGCPAIETLSFPKAERFDGDVSLATLPAIKDFGEFLPALKAISGDLSIDDLSSLEGVLDLSGCTFSPNSTLDLRLVAATRLTELRGGDFGGSLRIDASSLTPQPEAMPFEITGFKSLDTLRIAGFTHISALSLPTESCDDLTIENCGSQAPFTLSLPNLVEVRGTLLCRNCGKAGEANSASFPRLRNIGRQLSFYVGASSFTALEFPLLETIGNGEPVSDDPADDYALYTMPSGCAGEFILPSLQRVNGSMLVSTWNTSTDRAVAFRFPSLQSVAGEISVGHTAYKNRSVATLDFSALTAAGAIRIGNLSSVTDFSTFTQVLPRLSEQTWSVTDCGYNPTYQQMLDGETGAESK